MALSLLHQSQIGSTSSQLASSAAFGNGNKVELSSEAQVISCGSSNGTGNGTTTSISTNRTLHSSISSSSSSSSSNSNARTATKFSLVPHAHKVHSPQPLLRPAQPQQATLLQWQAPSVRKQLPCRYRAWQGSAKGGRGGRPTEGNRGEEGKTGGEASREEKREVERERTGEEERKGVEGAGLGKIVGSDIALSSLWYMDPQEGSDSDPASAAAAAGAALTAEGRGSQPTGAGTEAPPTATGNPANKSAPSQQPAAAAAAPPLSPFASAASAAAAASSVPPTRYVPPDPVWRDVFPSYMQSREHTDDVVTSAAAASTFPPQQQQLPPEQQAPSPAGFDRWMPGRPYANINGIGGSVGNGVGSVGGGSGGDVAGVPGFGSTAGNGRPDVSGAHLHPSFSEPSLTQPSPPGPSGAAPGYQGPGYSNSYQGAPNGTPHFEHGGRSNGSSSGGAGDFGSVYSRSEEGYSGYASSAASSQPYPYPRSPSPMGMPGPQPGLGVGVGHRSVDYVWGPGFGGGGGGGGPYASNDPIWAAIRAEAKLEAEQEPILSSFLYASILAHDCFERSLGFVLANRLKNVTLLATQLMDVFDDVLMQPDIRVAIRADVQAVRDRDPSCRSYSCALLYYKGYHALQSYRIAHALWCRGQHILALALQSRISEVFAVDIHPAARIGRGILMDHGTGVVIGETAVIGDRVSLLQGVTLGGTGKEAGDRHPKIQEGVLIGAGATILGNIVIGRGSMVAAGALVLKSVPAHSMVAGSPAKIVGTLKEPTPALTMQHDVTTKYCEDWEASQQQQQQQKDSPDKKRLP